MNPDRHQTNLDSEATAEDVFILDEGQEVLELSERDMDALLAAIADPPSPNAAMLRALARWRERVIQD